MYTKLPASILCMLKDSRNAFLRNILHKIGLEHLLGPHDKPAYPTVFWRKEIAHVLLSILTRSSYPQAICCEYACFCDAYVAPLLGPSPSDLNGARPSSYMGDDGSPIEFSWVIESENSMTVRFTMEPLSSFDGSPSPPTTWMSCLRSLHRFSANPDFDISWSQICFESLVQIRPLHSNKSQHASQFSVGADFTKVGMVGKSYFLPHLRSQAMGVTQTQLVTTCMTALGLESSWMMVLTYISTLPVDHQAGPEIVSVDCVEPSKNRAKVYIRTQASNLRAIIDLMTLGGTLSSPSILSAIATLRHLWFLLFGEVEEAASLHSTSPGHYASGFVVYFEMGLGRPIPSPKVYIPVRHYCDNDTKIAKALAQYYKEIGLPSVGDHYLADIQSFFPHRDLSIRTGIHTYIGCAARKSGSQVSMYYSPEIFAPERNEHTGKIRFRHSFW